MSKVFTKQYLIIFSEPVKSCSENTAKLFPHPTKSSSRPCVGESSRAWLGKVVVFFMAVPVLRFHRWYLWVKATPNITCHNTKVLSLHYSRRKCILKSTKTNMAIDLFVRNSVACADKRSNRFSRHVNDCDLFVSGSLFIMLAGILSITTGCLMLVLKPYDFLFRVVSICKLLLSSMDSWILLFLVQNNSV